jgi:ABC-type Zn uptake system ZnuABC Zn-binding protein ZnuA
MKLKIKQILSLVIVLFVCQVCFAVRDLPVKKIKVAVTTSHLASIVNEICKDKVEIIEIIPPTICPSTYDMDAAKLKEISKANILMYHDSQQKWIKELRYKIYKLGIVYRGIKTEGNFMIPYINLRAAEEIKDLFIIWDSDNKDFYEDNFINYAYKIKIISEEIAENNALRYNKKIICHTRIEDFLQWLGFDVVMKYNKPENITPAEMKMLTKKAKKENVAMIVDNLQIGTDVGRVLSKDLKIKHVVISNFPLGNSYLSTLKDNVSKIDKALQQ